MSRLVLHGVLVIFLGSLVGCGSSEPPPNNNDLPQQVDVPPAPKGGSKMKVMEDPAKKN